MKRPQNELLDFIFKEMPQYFDEQKHIGVRPVYKIPPGQGRKNGAYNLSILEGKKGIYCIYEERPGGAPMPVYIGMSVSDLYKTVTRHFQNWDSKSGNYPGRVSYRGSAQIGTAFFVEAYTDAKHTLEIEEEAIMKMRPRDNNLKLFRYEKNRAYDEKERKEIAQMGTSAQEVKDFSPPEAAQKGEGTKITKPTKALKFDKYNEAEENGVYYKYLQAYEHPRNKEEVTIDDPNASRTVIKLFDTRKDAMAAINTYREIKYKELLNEAPF